MTGLVLATLLAAPGNPFLAQARELYQSLDFERCVARLEQASTQWQSTKDELRDVELYGGLCHLSLGHRKEAAEHFRTALRIDEAADLPPYSSPKAVDLFLEMKKSLQAPPAPLPEDDLPPDAPKATRLEPQRPAPSPAGPSFVERRPVTTALGITTAVAFAVGLGLGVNARNLSIQANEARVDAEFAEKASAAGANATGANIAYGVASAALVGAIIAAVIEGQPSSN
jgi:tetratricopeptide (TPR) repeat protein